jgi:hypothetical protein
MISAHADLVLLRDMCVLPTHGVVEMVGISVYCDKTVQEVVLKEWRKFESLAEVLNLNFK